MNPFSEPFLYAPDEPLSGADTSATPAPITAPEAQPAPAAPPASATTATPTGQDQWQGVRDALKGYGLDLGSRFQDDGAALGHLANAYANYQRIAPQWQEFLPHMSEFQRWRAEQQKAKEPEPKGWEWKSPNYDPAWESQLTRDPVTGQLVAAPGAPPDLAQRYFAGKREANERLHELLKNPLEAIKPGLQELIDQRAQALIQQHLGGYQDQSYAQQVVQQNSSWIFERDASGQQIVDPISGQPQMTGAGRFYAGAVAKAQQLGVRDPRAQHEYAMTLLGATVRQQQAPVSPEAQNEAIKQNLLLNNGTRNGQPATPPSQNPSEPPLSGSNALRRQMLKDLEQAGVAANARLAG